jgi:hypothetical protein
MTAVDHNNMQDWAVDYNGEGQERVVRDGRDSRVVMMAAAAEDGSGGGRRRRTMKAADDDSTQDLEADYEGGGGERVSINNGIRHKADKPIRQRA